METSQKDDNEDGLSLYAYHSGQVLPHFITASLRTGMVLYIFMFDYAHLVVIANLTLHDTLF